jgi:hypothetical protein
MDFKAYCILCDKEFASLRNLKIHEERLHQVCKKPNFICNFCNTGFEHYTYYEAHFSARLKRSLAKKSRKKKDFTDAEIKRTRLDVILNSNKDECKDYSKNGNNKENILTQDSLNDAAAAKEHNNV